MFTFEILGVDCLPRDRHFGVHRSRIVGGGGCSFEQRPQAAGNTAPPQVTALTEHCRGREKGESCWLTSFEVGRGFSFAWGYVKCVERSGGMASCSRPQQRKVG